MVNNLEKTNIEDIQELIKDICIREYGPINSNRYFIVKNTTVSNVRQNILNQLENEENKKMKYLDMTIYVLQVGNDVSITLN